MHAHDLILAVRRDDFVDPARRVTAEDELRRRMNVAKAMLISGDIAGSSTELLEGMRAHLRRLPHADPRDQARALRGIASGCELTHPEDAIILYREARELDPRIRDVKDRLKKLEARVAASAQKRR
jgi:hypothetical protein